MALLEIKELCKTFRTPEGGEAATIYVPHLELDSGAAMVLDGSSGSGKTTVLHMVSGLLQPDSGQIFFAAQEVSGLSAEERDAWRAANIGYIFQRLNLLEELTVIENIMLPFCWRAKMQESIDELRTRAEKLLEQVGLTAKITSFPHTLSIGEQQRVAVVRALLGRPRLMLADEPTASMDCDNGQLVLELLQQLCCEQNVALLFCTHDEAVKSRFSCKYNVRSGCYE